eukprot:TRINITY_DN51706_c0_g1_i1.p1 TRINITY_DN51706_c0_g1~~TRINITY_DN51706_c0_g1_i1.p1  ORF type:complete len:383 (+),score=219.96 TRINITY_DN51706_c0_g1_i1:86-1234(+)
MSEHKTEGVDKAPSAATAAVLVQSLPIEDGTPAVKGYDFNEEFDFDRFCDALLTTGFQASHLGQAIREVNKMLKWRLSDEPVKEDDVDEVKDPAYRAKTKCTIFLGMTSNMVSSGVREVVRFLVQHKLVQCIVTTAGAIEEDLMKCFSPHYMGSFDAQPGRAMRMKGHNRIGNLIVPNLNYCALEEWMMPLLDEMVEKQKSEQVVWSPSKIIKLFGERIDNEESVWYWAAKNDIPVFCPAITDGSVGDMIYFHSYRNPGLIVDIASDIRAINDMAVQADRTGMIILGGGLIKHHICNANLMRNGADYSVFINTGQEFDGSDSGARPDEAISWGKIKLDAKPVKVYGDATVMFPLLVAQTFYKEVQRRKQQEKKKKNGKSGKQ